MIFPVILSLLALGFTDARPKHTAVACPSGMHIVGVRGTLEDPGHGALKKVVDGLMKMYPGSDDFAIDYPAEGVSRPEKPGDEPGMDLIQYQVSLRKGYEALKLHLQDYSKQCENTKVLLLGYSQGAHVIGDALCGNKNFLAGSLVGPISSGSTANIEGVVLLGDPSNNGEVPWHQGNGSYSGMFKRLDYLSCGWLLDEFGQSWCDDQDFFCEFAQWRLEGSIDVHMRYVSRHEDEILVQAKKLIDRHEDDTLAQVKKIIDSHEGQVDKSRFVYQGLDL